MNLISLFFDPLTPIHPNLDGPVNSVVTWIVLTPQTYPGWKGIAGVQGIHLSVCLSQWAAAIFLCRLVFYEQISHTRLYFSQLNNF